VPVSPPPLERGRAALDRGVWEEARAAFEEALAQGETAEALEGLGWALFWLDRAEEGLEARERAFLRYRSDGDRRSAARVAYGLAVDSIDFRGEAPSAGWLDKAGTLLDGLDEGPEHGWLWLWEGHFALLTRADVETARSRAAAARELAHRLDLLDLETLARALDGLVRVAEGDVEEGMRRLDEATATALSGEVGGLSAVGATCCLLVHACERARDYARAEQWGARVQRFSRRWSISPALAVCRTQHAAMLIGRGAWDDAELELSQARDQLAASRPLLAAESLEQLGELRRRQGRWDEAEEHFARADGRSLPLLGRGAMALDRGDPPQAVDLLERFLRRTPLDNWSGRAAALELLVRARLAQGRRRDAELAASQLEELASRVTTPTIRAASCVAAGLLDADAGRGDDARRRFEDAVDLFAGSLAPFECARARLDLAECLLGIGRVDTARQEARVALGILEELGASHEAARAQELMARPPARRPAVTAASGPGGELSPREVEVLRLVAQGLGDKEIADRLNLSGHTIHRHVSNIRTKLGLPSRAAAVAWAAQNGVL
jgi:LuxR family maltose regulon positive regulatory protein